MEIKPGYKMTEIGIIPDDWEISSIKNLCPLQRGFDLPRKQAIEGAFPVIYSNGTLNSHNTFQVKSPGVVTGRSGTIGKVVYVEDNFWPHNTTLWVTNFHGNNPKYIYYLLTSIGLHRWGTGSGVPTLNRNDVHEILVAKPTTNEQKRIADTLSDIDSLITSLEKLIGKKKLIKQGAMQELLTGKKRLPGFSGKWETKTIDDIFSYERPDKYIHWDTDLENIGSVPVLTANKSFILGYAKCADGICSNLPAIIFDDFTTDSKFVSFPFKVKSSAIKILRTKHRADDLRFIHGLMKLIKFSLGGHKRYYLSEYRHLEVIMPSSEEQKAISDVLESMDSEIKALTQQLSKYRLIKEGMMQELLTGRIRLI